MNKIKIAVIDSGVDPSYNYFKSNCIDSKSFICTKNNEVIEENNAFDTNGHGTAVAHTILRSNKNDIIIPIKVINSKGRTSSKCLIKALEYLIDVEVDIINVSLSTKLFDYQSEFTKICDELIKRNRYIVASMDNSFKNSLPALLPSVIGVRGKNFMNNNSYWYNPEYNIQCICDEEPILVPGINGTKFNFFTHNSKATAVMTSNISNILKKYNNLNYNELQSLLTKYAIKNVWHMNDLQNDISCIKITKENSEYFEEKYIDVYKLIKNNFNSELKYDYLLDNNVLSIQTGINKSNLSRFLYLFEKTFNATLDCDAISLRNINSIYELIKLI